MVARKYTLAPPFAPGPSKDDRDPDSSDSDAGRPPAMTLEVFYIDTSPFVREYQQRPGPDENHTRGREGEEVYDWRGMGKDGGPRGRAVATLRQLRKALAASTATYKVVVGHHPIRSQAGAGDTPELIDSDAAVRLPVAEAPMPGAVIPDDPAAAAATRGGMMLDAVLWEGGVHVYVNGHDNNLQHIALPTCCSPGPAAGPPGSGRPERGGAYGPDAFPAMGGRQMHYVTSGAGSKVDGGLRPAPPLRFGDDKRNGFVHMRATPRALHVEYVGDDGRVIYAFDSRP